MGRVLSMMSLCFDDLDVQTLSSLSSSAQESSHPLVCCENNTRVLGWCSMNVRTISAPPRLELVFELFSRPSGVVGQAS